MWMPYALAGAPSQQPTPPHPAQIQWNPSAAATEQLLPPPTLDEVAKAAARAMIEGMDGQGPREVPKVLPSAYTIKQVRGHVCVCTTLSSRCEGRISRSLYV